MPMMFDGGYAPRGYFPQNIPYGIAAPAQPAEPAFVPPPRKKKVTKRSSTSLAPKKKKTSSSSSTKSSGTTTKRSSSSSSGSSRRSYSGGGGSSSGSSSRRSYSSAAADSTPSIGSTPTGKVSAPQPPVPSIEAFLGQDSTYQGQIAALNKALGDYRAQNTAEIGQYNADWARNRNDLGIARDRDDEALQGDFAGRGLFVSGLMAKDRGDLLGDYARRFSDLDTSRANWVADQQRNLTNFQSEQNLSQQRAKQEAIQRRALQYQV